MPKQRLHLIKPVDRPPEYDKPSSGAAFSTEEKRRILKAMVVGEMEAGFLRFSKRQALMQYAAHLGIEEFDACLLIAEAQYHAGDIKPMPFDPAATLASADRPAKMSLPSKLAFALTAALLIDLLLIHWLFY